MKVKNIYTNKEYEISHFFDDVKLTLEFETQEGVYTLLTKKALTFENHTTSDTAILKINDKTIICEDIQFFEVLYELLKNCINGG